MSNAAESNRMPNKVLTVVDSHKTSWMFAPKYPSTQ